MGQLWEGLKGLLGSILSFLYDMVDFAGPGVAWGLSIILLTIVINIAVFPLTLKQTRATRAFTAIQPKIKKIQAEYKDDPQEMQKQLLAVQKEAGATPGGCLLPLLVQMPIWIALFNVLRDTPPLSYVDPASGLGQTIAEGTARFVGMNLTETPATAFGQGILYALPYLVLILIMVVTQYVQQWHATAGQVKNADPRGAAAQQTITKVLPLFIGFISWNFPAGLVLYWTTGNLFRLGQQALIFKIDGRPSVPKADSADESEVEVEGGEKKPQQGAADKRRRRRRN